MSLEVVEKWGHLRDVPIPEEQSRKVEMHIGQDCPEVTMPLETRACNNSAKPAPFAIRTLLRWTMNGPMGGHGEKMSQLTFCLHPTPEKNR